MTAPAEPRSGGEAEIDWKRAHAVILAERDLWKERARLLGWNGSLETSKAAAVQAERERIAAELREYADRSNDEPAGVLLAFAAKLSPAPEGE